MDAVSCFRFPFRRKDWWPAECWPAASLGKDSWARSGRMPLQLRDVPLKLLVLNYS